MIAAALATAFGAAHAQQTVKIGMPLTLSGQFADAASQMLNGAKTYMKMHGDTVS
jgi:branched-chain amino acid transport system substrate-binding protein